MMHKTVASLAVGFVCCLSGGASPFPSPVIRVANSSLAVPLTSSQPFPATLAETGAFADLATLAPNPGVIPFEINVPLWSDGAHKKRWFALRDTTSTIGFERETVWTYPTGMVWIKQFTLELTNGVPESARRLETRFLVRTADGIYGASYRWDDSQRNAALVPAQGMDEPLLIHEVDGTVRSQVWHYPSRNECRTCHNAAAGYVLGFNTAQLNCDIDLGDRKINQIRALSDAGYFQNQVTNVHTLRALVAATNSEVSAEYRVRSYLSANCIHCHQPGAPCGFAPWNAQLGKTLPETGLINGLPLMDLGDPENRIVTPGRPDKSVLFARVANLGPSHMPLLCTSVLNTEAVDLLMRWIGEELTVYRTYAQWQMAYFGGTNHPSAGRQVDADNDGAPNYLEYLTGGNPLMPSDTWRITVRRTAEGMEIRFPRAANRGYEVQWSSHLERADSWQPLDVPGNRPFFAASGHEAVVVDPNSDAATKFYRVRIYEP